ncbi:TIGR01777 family oxidoreductase [Fredinandcohnia sp. QZ13]|uniref:TIGR01777 family oxidoreductase n=1 Tax=Fredinandcohnia sp. QZ13 TaxID=3073144 RepID=UPI0028535770|nr:TIGR01777 family oxidoreductase [Fredinandcohnia sp. QZ13]MDR4887588.1 TIGR01777 family oxidoreductase [Fredinandcohnia sp. QZ13]
MKIAIAGGTGFVGKSLTDYLLDQNHEVFILTRNAAKASHHPRLSFVEWLKVNSAPETELQDVDAVINLAGESLNSGRWTEARKKRILESRVTATKEIVRILSSLPKKPKVLLNASAVGIYGISESETFTEEATQIGNDFLANTVSAWEQEANKASTLGVRTCFLRFGVVLGANGGALTRIVLPYQFFIGGTIGSGKQWLSWIHIDDVLKGIDFLLHHENVSGPINFTAPNPVQMKEFGQTAGTVLHRPHWLPVPGFALQLLLGEMSMLVLEGQKVLPKKLVENGFSFTYETVEKALSDIFRG